jgi:putative Holliday junction resolvase
LGRVLGIDPGTKRIGFALSDELHVTASPLEVWPRKKSLAEDLAHVEQLVRAHDVERVVVGVPYRLDGSKGPAADKALAFIEALRGALPEVQVDERDEALTTWEADERLKERGLNPEERRKIVDAHAAAVILQEALDAKR